MRVDRLTIDAVVSDGFSDTLDHLADQLLDVAESQTLVDENQTIDVDVEGLGELTALNTELAALSTFDGGDVDIDTESDSIMGDIPHHITVDDVPSHISVENINDDTSTTPTVPTPFVDGGGGETTTADGGDDSNISMAETVRRMSEQFGQAFDSSPLVDNPDRIHRTDDLLDGSLSDFMDTNAIRDALLDDSSPITGNVLEDLEVLDEDTFDALDLLRREGASDLPTRRGRIAQMLPDGWVDNFESGIEAFENFDATTLNNLYASFVPLMVTFIGALPAAVAGLGALAASALSVAAAFGAVGALGALGVMLAEDQSLSDLADDLRTSFKEAFGPIAEALRPSFLEAVDSVELFFDALGDRTAVLRTLSEESLDALDALEQFALGGLTNLIQLARMSEPLIADLFARMGDVSIVRVVAGVLADTYGLLIRLGAVIATLIPTIYRLSKGFLAVVTGVLAMVSVWGMLLNAIPMGTELFGVLIATILVFITTISLAITVQKLWASSLVQTVVSAIGSAITSLYALVAAKYADIAASYGAATATLAFAAAAAVAIGVVTLGIGAVMGLAGGFSILGGEIGKATKKLDKFSKQKGRFGGSFSSGFGGSTNGGSDYVDYTDNSKLVIEAPDRETGTQTAERADYRSNHLTPS